MSFIVDYFSSGRMQNKILKEYIDGSMQTEDDMKNEVKQDVAKTIQYNVISVNHIPISIVTDEKLDLQIDNEIVKLMKENMIIKKKSKAAYIYKDGSLLYTITTKRLEVIN